MQIDAVVLRGSDEPFTLESVDLEQAGPSEVLVRIEASGMCHTDLSMRHQSFLPSPLPAVFGHEGAGIVEEVGSNITRRIAVGDHVLLSYDSCGTCGRCLVGEPFYCELFVQLNSTARRLDGSTGIHDSNGVAISSRWAGQSSFATHAVANERNIVVVDRDLPLEHLAPFGCGVQTGAGSILNGMKVGVGSRVGVFGTGTVGLSAVIAAKLAGASEIVAVDLNPARCELALELGATHSFDGSDPDLLGQIGAATGPLDYILDTTGVPSVIKTAIQATSGRGVCGMVGAPTGELTIHPGLLAGRTLTLFVEGDAIPQIFLPMLIKLYRRGLLPIDRLITTYDLVDANQAEDDMLSGKVIKPVFTI